MAKKSNDPKIVRNHATMPLKGAFAGSAFTVAWVIAVAAMFYWLQSRFEISAQLLTDLIWPIIALSLGVPFIVFIWFGGFSIVVGMANLREHLEKLDNYVSSFDDMESRSAEIRSNMDSASLTVSSAANTFSANLDRFEQDVKPVLEKLNSEQNSGAKDSPKEEQDDADLKQKKRRLGHLINLADAVLYQALNKRNERPGKGKRRIVVSPGGSDKASISQQLSGENWLDREVSTLMVDIYTMDMATRPTRRASLTDEDLSQLESRQSVLQAAQSRLSSDEAKQ